MNQEYLNEFQNFIKQQSKFKAIIFKSQKVEQVFKDLNSDCTEFLQKFLYQEKKLIINYNQKEKVYNPLNIQIINNNVQAQMEGAEFDKLLKQKMQEQAPNIQKKYYLNQNIDRHLKEQHQTPQFTQLIHLTNDYTKNYPNINIFDEPQCIINVIMSEEENFCKTVDQLMIERNQRIESVFKSQLPRYNIVIHDNGKEQNFQEINKKYEELKIYMQNNKSKLFPLNLKEAVQMQIQDFNQSDRLMIQTTFAEIIELTVKSLESKMIQYHYNLNQNNGLFSGIKSFMAQRDPKTIQNNNQYTSLEIQRRSLADILFMFQDYEAAFKQYDLLKSDIKNKSQKFYANCMELLAITQIQMIQQSQNFRRDTEQIRQNFDTAFTNYMTDKSTVKFALRTNILKIYATKIFQNFKLDSINIELKEQYPLFYPIFQEQQSILDLLLKKPKIRNYALDLSIAGNKYSNCNLNKYAIKCFQIVISIYESLMFQKKEDYFYSYLIKLYYQEGQLQDSINYFIKFLNHFDSRHTPQQIEQCIREKYKYANTDQIDFDKINPIKIPQINENKVDISLESENFQIINVFQIGSFYEQNKKWDQKNHNWQQLVKHFKLEISKEEQNIINIFDSKYVEQKNSIFNLQQQTTYLSENIYISFLAKNPLQMQIQMTQIKVITNLEEIQIDQEIIIAPLQSVKVNLSFKPQKLGQFKILKLQWNIFDLPTNINFNFYGNYRKLGSSYQFSNYNQIKKNHINVQPETGKLKINVIDYDKEFFQNQIKIVKIQLQNSGKQIIKMIQIMTQYEIEEQFKTFNCQLKEDDLIELEINLRAYDIKTNHVCFLIRYQCENSVFKFNRLILPMQILPSVSFNFQTEQCLQKHFVHMDITEHIFRSNIQILNIIIQNKNYSFQQQSNDIDNFYIQKIDGKKQLKDYENKIYKPYQNELDCQNLMISILWSLDVNNQKSYGIHTCQIKLEQKNQQSLKINLIYENQVFLDENDFCETDLQLIVENISQKKINLSVQALDNPKNGFFFDGLLKGVKNIDSKVNLNNITCFFQKGIFNLNVFEFLIDKKHNKLQENFFIEVMQQISLI